MRLASLGPGPVHDAAVLWRSSAGELETASLDGTRAILFGVPGADSSGVDNSSADRDVGEVKALVQVRPSSPLRLAAASAVQLLAAFADGVLGTMRSSASGGTVQGRDVLASVKPVAGLVRQHAIKLLSSGGLTQEGALDSIIEGLR